MDKRIPLHAKDITGDLQTLSGYVVALRSGTFASNNILGTEAEDQPGYYDFTGIETNVAYQLWAGTTEGTMSMNTTFSSEEGTVLFGVDDANFLDAADFEDNQIIVKKTIDGVEQLIPYDLQDLITDEGIEVDSAGVEYKFVRGVLCQDNSVFSGKAFFGSIIVNDTTGLLQGVASAYYVNGVEGTRISIADFIKRADSLKVSTGIYYLQCQLGTPGSGTNGFTDGLEGSIYNYKFEQSVIPIFGERIITYDEGLELYSQTVNPVLKGYLVVDTITDPLTYYGTGKVLLRTYNTSWVLADNILSLGYMVTIKANNI